jgi:hypothetical protein
MTMEFHCFASINVHNSGAEKILGHMNMRWFTGIVVVLIAAGSWSDCETPVDAARRDLATRLEIPLEQVSVLSQTEITWPDRSLGCPRKGMMYPQVITNGSQLILQVAGRSYFYHSAVDRPYFYCDLPAKKSGAAISTPRYDI